MCMFPKAPKIPPPVPPAQFQAMQNPKDLMQDPRDARSRRIRRGGMWATVFTSPQGVSGMPAITGSSGGLTGG